MPPTRSSTRAGGGLNLAALINPAPASTELPDDDFDPTGGALTRDGDGDFDDGDGFSTTTTTTRWTATTACSDRPRTTRERPGREAGCACAAG